MIPGEIQEFDKNKSWELGQRIQKERLKKEISAADLAEYMGIRANQLCLAVLVYLHLTVLSVD